MGHVKVIVDKNNWSIKIEGEGFVGRQCKTPLDEVQKILGGSATRKIPKDTMRVKDKLSLKG